MGYAARALTSRRLYASLLPPAAAVLARYYLHYRCATAEVTPDSGAGRIAPATPTPISLPPRRVACSYARAVSLSPGARTYLSLSLPARLSVFASLAPFCLPQ